MAPSTANRKAIVDKRVQNVVDIAAKLQRLLQERSAIPSNLQSELDIYVKQTPLIPNGTATGDTVRTMDSSGTGLWNAAAGLIASDNYQHDPRVNPIDNARLGAQIRLFALLLLDAAYVAAKRRTEHHEQKIRISRISLRIARHCLENDQLDLALVALEICSLHTETASEPAPLMQMSDSAGDKNENQADIKILYNEYLLLRVLHAWKSKRLDLGEHFYAKLKLTGTSEPSGTVVKAADLFADIAQSQQKRNKHDDAMKWYRRALRALDTSDDDTLSSEAADLLLSICTAYCELLLSLHHNQRAWEVVTKLDSTHGLANRVLVPILKFRVLSTQKDVDQKQISTTLLSVVNLTMLSNENVKITMRTLRKASQVASRASLVALREFVYTRLLPAHRDAAADKQAVHSWLEKALVTYAMLASAQNNAAMQSSPEDFSKLLDACRDHDMHSISTKATHAIQTLLWKAGLRMSNDMTIKWFDVLVHPLFDNAGHVNKARIGRKLMRLALDNGNVARARKAYFQMPTKAQNEGPTRQLAFRLALAQKDEDLAMSSLQVVTKMASRDSTYLYACVLEAQRSDMKQMAVAALQALLDVRPPGIHLCTLLRCTARLIASEMHTAGQNINQLLEEAAKIFEAAAQSIDEFRKLSDEQWRLEIQWWSKNAYNLAVQVCADADPGYVIRLVDVCSSFLEQYPADAGLMQQDRVAGHKLLCAFLCTSALIVKARSGDENADYTAQCFLHAQQRIDTYKAIVDRGKNEHFQNAQLEARTFAMLKFELECILNLREWHRLEAALASCMAAGSIEQWDTLADMLIVIHEHMDAVDQATHGEALIKMLQRIINDTWKKDKDIAKVARWVRFTFTLCLEHKESDFSFKLLEQAAMMTNNGYKGKHDAYPEAEVYWLAATSFNHAVDILVEAKGDQQDVDNALRWMEAALELAKWAADNGSLHSVLSQKLNAVKERAKIQQA